MMMSVIAVLMADLGFRLSNRLLGERKRQHITGRGRAPPATDADIPAVDHRALGGFVEQLDGFLPIRRAAIGVDEAIAFAFQHPALVLQVEFPLLFRSGEILRQWTQAVVGRRRNFHFAEELFEGIQQGPPVGQVFVEGLNGGMVFGVSNSLKGVPVLFG